MSVTYLEPFGVNTSANYTFANVLVTANITNNGNVNFIGASNVSLGSNATVRITGGSSGGVLTTNGSGGLTWSTQVANALVAGTVYTNAQPNITSVGSLNSLTVTGLITATGTGLKAANIQDTSGTITITTKYNSVSGDVGIYGNLNVGTSGTGFFIGDGGYISNITSGNITGQVANALVAGTVYTNAQPNITSVGSLSALTVSGNLTVSGIGNIGYGQVGEVLKLSNSASAADKWLTVKNLYGDFQIGTQGNIGAYLYNGATSPLDFYTNASKRLSIANTGETQILSTTTSTSNSIGALVVSGGVGVAGNIHSGGLISATANITGNFFIGNGSQLTGINATTGNANYANFAGNIVNAIQSNITSVGTLATVTHAANANVIMSGSLSQISGPNLVSANYVTTTANGNILMSGTLSQISGANLISGTYLTGTLTTAAQPNITSVGTLVSLGVTGTTTSGNFATAGNITASFLVSNVATGTAPIQVTSNTKVTNLNADLLDGYDTATAATANTVVVRDANANITANNISSGTHTLSANANIIMSGSLSQISGPNLVSANYVTTTANGNITMSGTLSRISGANLVSATYLTGTLTTAAQPNITSLGTLINTLMGSSNSLSGGNLVSATYLTGTLTTAAQGNITSVGTMASITLAANANVTMSGALSRISGANLVSANYVTTTANGNISMSGTLSQISGANLISGTYLTGTLTTAAQGNITSVGTMASITLAANANVTMSGSLSQISGPNLVSANYVTTTANGNITMSGTLSRISGANLISGTYLTGTLTTAIQGNITSVGTLASLGVTGTTTSGNFATAGNITASFLVSNVATGTAPFTVTSTTRVANLNVAYANVSDYSAISTASTGNYYLNMVNALTGNVQEYANASLVANATSGTFYSNNAALTNNLYTKYLTVSSISQESFSTITSATGIVVHNVSNGPTFYHTTPSANFTPNFTNVTVTANTTTIVSLIIVQGATPYMPTATANIQIEGANNTINWLFGVAPIGTASKIDIVNFSLVRTSSAWTVLGQAATFG